MFLTKNPQRYHEFEFTGNCWLGTTLDHVKYKSRIEHLKTLKNKTFASIEPILSDMSEVDFSGIDLLIIGSDSSKGAAKPKYEWVKSISHENIFYKESILRCFP